MIPRAIRERSLCSYNKWKDSPQVRDDFFTEVRKCAERYPSDNLRNHWATPPQLINWIAKTFAIKVERYASPFNFNETLNCFCSRDVEMKFLDPEAMRKIPLAKLT